MWHDTETEHQLYDIYDDDLLVRGSPNNLIRGVVYKLLVGIRVENQINLYKGIRFSVQGRSYDETGEWVDCGSIGKTRKEYEAFRLNVNWEINAMAEQKYSNQQLFLKLFTFFNSN